jgi:hypothetical protein
MAPAPPGRLRILCLGASAVETVLWQMAGRLHVTVAG